MNIYESITGIMNEGAAVAKNKKNQQQGFQYRGIDDVMNTFQPLLAKYKVFMVPEVIDRQREERQTTRGGNLIYSILTIRYTFYAEDGSSISAVVVGEGMDSGDKASNKAMAVAMKYAMFQTFCIPTEEMNDPDAETPEPSTPQKPTAQNQDKKPTEPKPEKPEPLVCERCGKTIGMAKNDRGEMKNPQDQVAFSRKAFGRDYCLDCSKIEYAAARKAAMQSKMNEEENNAE